MTKAYTIVAGCLISFTLIIIACSENETSSSYDEPAGSGGWLTGDIQEKFDKLADQHQGFSRAMQEVRYRYNEMYFAGQDENWEYAKYHGEKILGALESGFERRPAREESADRFVNTVMPEMLNVFENEDSEAFEEQFNMVKNECNACHAMEEVEFINVVEPEHRLSPVKWERPE